MLNVSGNVPSNPGVLSPGEPLHSEVGGHDFVQDGGVIFQGVVQRHRRGQDLVVHLYQAGRLLGNVGAYGSHSGHSVALEESLLPRHHVLGHQAGIAQHLGEVDGLGVDQGEVQRRRHRGNTGKGLGLAGIYGTNAGVGVGTAQDFAVEHSRQLGVRAVLGGPGDLFQAVVADGPGAQYPIFTRGRALPLNRSRHRAYPG